MPWTTPPTYTVGQVLTSSNLNTYLSGNENFLYNGSLIPISDTLLIASAASFDITSIPATWVHLRIVLDGRSDTSATSTSVGLRFNNDSAANYDYQYVQSNATTNTAAEAFAQTSVFVGSVTAATAGANVTGSTVVDIANYTLTTFNKTTVSRSGLKTGTSTGNISIYSLNGFWRSTAAISRITLTPAAGNFIAGSRCTLYGLGVPT